MSTPESATTTGLQAGIQTPSAPVTPVPTPAMLSPTNPSVSTTTPTISVTVPNTSGTVTFSLVVTDNHGVQGAPAIASVNNQAPPTAVLTATPSSVPAGGAITLSGAGSTSSGSIASYLFSLLPAPTVVP